MSDQPKESLLRIMSLDSYGKFLDDTSLRTRKGLLAASTVAVVISVGNLAPTEITYFGLSAGDIEVERLYLVLALIVGYFLLQFLIYAFFDFTRFRVLREEQSEQGKKLVRGYTSLEGKLSDDAKKGELAEVLEKRDVAGFVALARQMNLIDQSGFAFSVKGVFDIFSPIAIGVAALAISVAQYYGQDVFFSVLFSIITALVIAVGIAIVANRKRIGRYVKERRKQKRRHKAEKLKPQMLDTSLSQAKRKELAGEWLNLMFPNKGKR